MSNESDELFRKIQDHLNPPKTEQEARRQLYKTIARKILTSLGHEGTITRVDYALQKQDDSGLKKLLEENKQNTDSYTQMIIETVAKGIIYIPDSQQSMQLLKTAISGIPAISVEKQDTIAEFHLAALSTTSTMNEINPRGQSKITAKPNKKGTDELLKRLLRETGFAVEGKFQTVSNALKRSGHFNWEHPDNNQLEISIEEPPKRKFQKSPDWSYHIKITHTKS